MSSGFKRKYAEMKALADQIMVILAPACERIELAGSLRRKREWVGDIEIVAIPKMLPNLFSLMDDDTAVFTTEMATEVDLLLADYKVTLKKNGPKYKQFTLSPEPAVFEPMVDLFLQPDPRTWGVNFLLRTGSREFSASMVRSIHKWGYLPDGWKVKNGLLHNRKGDVIETLEEGQFFEALGLPFVPVDYRDDKKWEKMLRTFRGVSAS